MRSNFSKRMKPVGSSSISVIISRSSISVGQMPRCRMADLTDAADALALLSKSEGVLDLLVHVLLADRPRSWSPNALA